MKRILTLLATLVFASSLSFAQTPVTGAGSVIFGSATPTGACSSGDWFVNTVSGSLYICSKGSWLSVGGSGGSGANTSLSNLASPTAINLTTLTFAGAAGLTALGTNQNVTLTPSGTGSVSIGLNGSSGHEALQFNAVNRGFYVDGSSTLILHNVNATLKIGGFYGNSMAATSGLIQSFHTYTFASTLTIDATLYNVFEVTLTGNVTTFNITTLASTGSAGECITLIWIQDATGTHTVAAPSNSHGFTTPGGTGGDYSTQRGCFDGTNWVFSTADVNIP